MVSPSRQIREVADRRDLTESEVLARALERGLEELWADVVVERYLADELTREGAVELVGVERIRRAEREGGGG